MRKLCTITFAVLTFSSLSGAQMPTSGRVFVGYSYSQGQAFAPSARHDIGMSGWEASVDGTFKPWLEGVADFDWHYGSWDMPCTLPSCTTPTARLNASRHALLFGPRVLAGLGRYKPFAQALLGFAHQTDTGGPVAVSDLAFCSSFGGGVDYRLLPYLAVRGQVEWLHARLFGAGQDDLRVSTGLVFRFH